MDFEHEPIVDMFLCQKLTPLVIGINQRLLLLKNKSDLIKLVPKRLLGLIFYELIKSES